MLDTVTLWKRGSFSTLDVRSLSCDYDALTMVNAGAYAEVALGERLDDEADAFPMTWTAEEMGRIVRALVARKGR